MDKEIRQYSLEFRACKNEDNKRTIEGRAIPFNTFSPNREGFREVVLPEAVEGVIEKSDIKLLYNHDNSKGFMARSNKGKGSLKIEVKEDGVYFSFPVKNDNLSNYVYERLQCGELSETSWAFVVADEEWKKCEDDVYERTIKRFDTLYDFSVVDTSYYGIPDVVGCKRFAEILEVERVANEKKLAELKAEEERAEQQRLEEYFESIRKENEKYL